ncbi:MAG TPA: DUF2827 domain-containing protein [Paraburkholderia sp.]|nr:DUF2827 domain-containing protein [Paraburkholderia sp.]
MRIGISVLTHAGQTVWENGRGQHVIFLARLFQKLPCVSSVCLIDVGDQGVMPEQVDLATFGLTLMPQREAGDAVDVIVEMDGAFDDAWLDLMRARGKAVVHVCCAHPFAAAESAVFDTPARGPRIGQCDEIWMPPQFQLFCAFLRTLHRCPVHIVPYLWHPQFLDQRVAQVEAAGLRFGWQVAPRSSDTVGPRALRVAIFEPNVSVTKTATIPLLACDEAYRADPSCVESLHVLNTMHMTGHPTLLHLANSLDLVREHKAVFHGRHDTAGFMAQHADAVVAHQWTHEQNVGYLDALYGDYPLIHNSTWLKAFGAGYFYPDFDAAAGGAELRRAASEHDANLAPYRARNRQLFDSLDPCSERNLRSYATRLLQLCRDKPFMKGRSFS